MSPLPVLSPATFVVTRCCAWVKFLRAGFRDWSDMAEHMNQKVEPQMDLFNKMGKPLSSKARQVAYDHCLQMGLNPARAWECVGAVANSLERDRPYEAQAAGMKFLDLTGTYRLFAALLAN